jgi:hypothetical protein
MCNGLRLSPEEIACEYDIRVWNQNHRVTAGVSRKTPDLKLTGTKVQIDCLVIDDRRCNERLDNPLLLGRDRLVLSCHPFGHQPEVS